MAQPKIDGEQIDGGTITGVDADALGGQIGSFYQNAGNLNAGTILSARLTGTYAISVSGNAATASNSSLLQGSNAAFFRNATNLNAGTINDARLPITITSNITGTAANSNALGGVAAGSWAKLASPALSGNPTAPTQAPGSNNTRLSTTAFVAAAVTASLPLEYKTSALLAYSGGNTTTTWNHGLTGKLPRFVGVYLYCNIAQGGYSVGDYLSLNHTLSESDSGGGPQNHGIAVEVSTTQVIVRVGNNGALSLTTGNANFGPSAANWSMLIRILAS